MSSFKSLYQPGYRTRGFLFSGLKSEDKKAILLAFGGHAFVFLLLCLFSYFSVHLKKEVPVIEVDVAMAIPDGKPDGSVDQPKESLPETKPAPQNDQAELKFEKKTRTKAVPKPVVQETQVVKEEKKEPIKPPEPVKVEPVKVEPVIEQTKVVPIPLKEEPLPKAEIKEAVTDKKPPVLPDATVDMPKPLPTLVDKKNKEKDAPELAAAKATRLTGDPSASPGVGGAQTAMPQAGANAATGSTSGPSSGSSASIQAQMANSPAAAAAAAATAPLGLPGGATTDAQYNSRELNNRMPPYPVMARKMRQEGTVVLNTEVLENGSAGEVRVAVTSGSELLDKVALETVKKWTFHPAKKDGVPYVQKLRIPITFRL